MRFVLAAFVFMIASIAPAFAWYGRDVDTDVSISIEDDDINVGEIEELHDENTDKFTDVEVKNVQKNDDGSLLITVYDSKKDATRNLEMEPQ